MSARTLRLIISVGLVFGFFFYIFSTQLKDTLPAKSPEEGLPGGPLSGLTGWQLARFEEGRALFQKRFSLAASKTIPVDAEFHGLRLAQPLYGLGLIDALADGTLQAQAQWQARTAAAAQGRIVKSQSLSPHWGESGKFGARAEQANLLAFTADELGREIGISNPLFNHTLTTTGLDNLPACLQAVCPGDPNDDGKILSKINFFLETLAPPPRGPITSESQRGNFVFEKIGCGVCHLGQLLTQPSVFVVNPDGPPLRVEEIGGPGRGASRLAYLAQETSYVRVRALENKIMSAYSDFLVHDMGPDLSDGTAQPGTTGGEWRTAPLWGLRYRRHYMHDGRALTLARAIEMHGGQGRGAAAAFARLSKTEKDNLLAFLASL